MKRHTSGDWTVERGEYCSVLIKSDHSIIALIPTDSHFCAAEVTENANLISAAPALAKALQDIMAADVRGDIHRDPLDTDGIFANALRALIKAGYAP